MSSTTAKSVSSRSRHASSGWGRGCITGGRRESLPIGAGCQPASSRAECEGRRVSGADQVGASRGGEPQRRGLSTWEGRDAARWRWGVRRAQAPWRRPAETGVVQAAWCRCWGSGARQQGPGLAVRPVCFRRVFGGLRCSREDLVLTTTTYGNKDCLQHAAATGLITIHLPEMRLLTSSLSLWVADLSIDFSMTGSFSSLARSRLQAKRCLSLRSRLPSPSLKPVRNLVGGIRR